MTQKKFNIFAVTFAMVIGALFAGCSPATNNSNRLASVPDPVVIDEKRTIADGDSASWKLEPGNYKLELSSSGDGARVEWVGSECAETKSVKTLTVTCEMQRPGQLVVNNHSVIGAGDEISVTVKLTKVTVLR